MSPVSFPMESPCVDFLCQIFPEFEENIGKKKSNKKENKKVLKAISYKQKDWIGNEFFPKNWSEDNWKGWFDGKHSWLRNEKWTRGTHLECIEIMWEIKMNHECKILFDNSILSHTIDEPICLLVVMWFFYIDTIFIGGRYGTSEYYPVHSPCC
jgi:hypothetical protein